MRLLSGVSFAVVLLLSSVASATTGYVCYSRRVAASTTSGSAGATAVTYYTQPACQGSYLATRNYCSANATLSACTNQSAYWYSEGQLNAFWTVLQIAGLQGTKVVYVDTTCNGIGADCGGWFNVYSTP